MFAGTDCLEGNICAAIRVLVMAERHCGGVLTLRRELESEGGGEKKKEEERQFSWGFGKSCYQILIALLRTIFQSRQLVSAIRMLFI